MIVIYMVPKSGFFFLKGPVFYSSLRSPATGNGNVQKLLTQDWVFIEDGRVFFLACSVPHGLVVC